MGSKILMIEDDKSIAMSLKFCLEQEGFEVTATLDGTSGLEESKKNYDLILLDLNLPDMHGFDFLRLQKETPVICLTASAEELSVIEGLELGAYDYITKPFKVRELIARMNAILRRRDLKPSARITLGNLTIYTNLAKVKKANDEIFLTTMEYKILLTLATNPNMIFTREKLLADIWDVKEEYVNDNTLTVYMKRLREKIEDDPNHPRIIVTVRGQGYKIGENL